MLNKYDRLTYTFLYSESDLIRSFHGLADSSRQKLFDLRDSLWFEVVLVDHVVLQGKMLGDEQGGLVADLCIV
jgi:hypothetical protein